jgi:DNA-binding transcriptional ArsR family regulator
MPSPKAALILHPVRLQIITAMSTQRMTAGELSEIMPDIPQTTLYRHLNALLAGGIIKIVEENPVRGTVERVYALVAPPSITPEDLRGMSKQDYEHLATLALSSFMSDIRRYLERKPDDAYIDFLADGLDLNKVQLNLSDDEFRRMNQQIFTIMVAAAKNQPSPERKRRIFSYLFIPVDV